MRNLLKEYVQVFVEATLRPKRMFYGANVTKSGKFFPEVVDGLLKSKKVIQKELDKKEFIEFQAAMQDLASAKRFLDQKFANRFIAKNVKETSSQITLSIDLISRAWSGQELKSANKGMVPTEFNNSIPIAFLTLPVMNSTPWLVAKQEELSAETNTLDNFNQSSFGDGQPKTVSVKSSQSGLIKTFKNVNGLAKSSDKAGHADFYFVDVDGKNIEGSGISHKAKGASDKSVAERYAGITKLMQNLAKKSSEFVDEALGSKGTLLMEAEEFVSSQETIDMISTFIEEAKKYYKEQALAGVEVAGFIKSIDIKEHKNELETMLYGPDKGDCTMLVISQVDKMTLKKVGKNYELDVGADGKVFIRPDIPTDPSYKPIFVCRFGERGSIFSFTKEETAVLKKKKKNLPSYVKFKNDLAYIPVRLYVSPAIRSPSKNAVDLSTLSSK
jgi:uncharacterized protein YacL (UPF0231 family)